MKKGSVADIAIILVLLFAGFLTVLVCVKFLGEFDALWTFGGESQEVLTAGIEAMHAFDYMMLFYAFGVSLFSIISAFYIKSHPGFFGVSIILLGILIMVSAQLTNILDKFITTTEFATVANNFPYMVNLMRNLPLFSLIIGILIAVVMYGKPSVGGGGL